MSYAELAVEAASHLYRCTFLGDMLGFEKHNVLQCPDGEKKIRKIVTVPDDKIRHQI